MTLKQIRELAGHHASEAVKCEQNAEIEERCFTDAQGATGWRERAQWHASTAVHLTEMADGLAEALQILSRLQLNP